MSRVLARGACAGMAREQTLGRISGPPGGPRVGCAAPGCNRPAAPRRTAALPPARKAAGSADRMPYSMLSSTRVRASAPAAPITTPVPPSSAAGRTTRVRTSEPVAPSAMRTPISCVRWLTRKASAAERAYQQVGDVGTRDQQQQGRGAEQPQQPTARRGQQVPQRPESRAAAHGDRRVLRRQAPRDGVHPGAGLGQAGVRPRAGDYADIIVIAPRGHPFRPDAVRISGTRRERASVRGIRACASQPARQAAQPGSRGLRASAAG